MAEVASRPIMSAHSIHSNSTIKSKVPSSIHHREAGSDYRGSKLSQLKKGSLSKFSVNNEKIAKPQKKPQLQHEPTKEEQSYSVKDYPALRILEPARTKLVTIDSQRLMWAVDEAVKSVEVITSLFLVLFQRKNEKTYDNFKKSVGFQLVNELNDFKTLNATLEKAYGRKDDILLESLEAQMCEKCQDLLRLFRAHQAAMDQAIGHIPANIAIVGGRKFHQPKKMIKNLKELRQMFLDRLLTTPIEVKERIRYLKKVEDSDTANNITIKKLEQQLAEAVKAKDKELHQKQDKIRKLKNDLHQIEQFTTESMKNTKRESEKRKESDLKDSGVKVEGLKHDLQLASNVYEKMLTQHRDSEKKLRQKKYKIETEVENWIAKYDLEMNEKQDEYEDIDIVYTEEKKRLNELEEKFKVLSEEHDKILEERKLKKEEKNKQDLDKRAKIEAATLIQAHFRAFKLKKVFKAEATKKAAKKNKNKGKGKKKKGKGKK